MNDAIKAGRWMKINIKVVQTTVFKITIFNLTAWGELSSYRDGIYYKRLWTRVELHKSKTWHCIKYCRFCPYTGRTRVTENQCFRIFYVVWASRSLSKLNKEISDKKEYLSTFKPIFLPAFSLLHAFSLFVNKGKKTTSMIDTAGITWFSFISISFCIH